MFKKIHYDTLPSTNKYLKENYTHYNDHTVISCTNQTNGKGRINRDWTMKPGDSLAFSILLKPDLEINNIGLISLITSVAVFQVVNSFVSNAVIKWPNDVLINGKKVCGILIETTVTNKIEALIIGIGININNDNFPDEIKSKATSLKLESNTHYNLDVILDEILYWFDYYYNQHISGDNSFMEIYRKYSSVIGNDYYLDRRQVRVVDVLENGNILVKQNDEMIEYSYGELSLESSYE